MDLHKKLNLNSFLVYKELIAELSETIIPKTDTPGAKDAGVENYIINVLVNCTGQVEQNKFLNGLIDLQDYTQKKFNKSYFKCNLNERTFILTHFEDKGVYSYQILNKINNKFLGGSFFSLLKNLTIEGYCFSKIGATEGLAYDYIPGSYEACIPLSASQKSWATK